MQANLLRAITGLIPLAVWDIGLLTLIVDEQEWLLAKHTHSLLISHNTLISRRLETVVLINVDYKAWLASSAFHTVTDIVVEIVLTVGDITCVFNELLLLNIRTQNANVFILQNLLLRSAILTLLTTETLIQKLLDRKILKYQ